MTKQFRTDEITAGSVRLFKCSVQEEPFAGRVWVAGRQPNYMRAVRLEEASQYTEQDIGRAVKRIRDFWGPNVIITVH